MPLLTVKGRFDRPVAYRFDQGLITIGRSEANHLVLRDADVSRLHAEIRRDERNAWSLADRGSRNATRLNGEPVLARAGLRPGDEIRVGPIVLIFGVEMGAGAAALPEESRQHVEAGLQPRLRQGAL